MIIMLLPFEQQKTETGKKQEEKAETIMKLRESKNTNYRAATVRLENLCLVHDFSDANWNAYAAKMHRQVRIGFQWHTYRLVELRKILLQAFQHSYIAPTYTTFYCYVLGLGT